MSDRSRADPLDRAPLLLWLAALTLLALAARLALWGHYTLQGSECDGAAYLEIGRQIRAGHGYVTNAWQHLWNHPAHFPMPESKWSPLFSYLAAGLMPLVGDSWTTGKLVVLLFGVSVPALTVWLGAGLSGRRSVGLIAGVLAALHPTLVTWSLRVLTEVCSIALVAAVYALALKPGRGRAALLGALLGLAYLMKYQNALLWVAVAGVVVLERGWRRALADLWPAAAAYALVIAPWLVRNVRVFGDPFYTDLKWMLLSQYPAFEHQLRFFARPDPPPLLVPWGLAHPHEVVANVTNGARIIANEFLTQHKGSWLLIPLVPFGLGIVRRHWKRWLPFAVYLAILAGGALVSAPQSRYLLSALPLYLTLAAAGAVWLAERGGALRAPLVAAAALLIAGALANEALISRRMARDETSPWNPRFYFCPIELMAAAPWVRQNVEPGEPIVVCDPSHGAYLLGRPAVRAPFDEAQLAALRDRYRIRWLIWTERDEAWYLPGWRTSPPAWAHLVWTKPPEQYAPEALRAGYRELSPVRIYRLDATPR